MKGIKDKVALVTGGAHGIGRASAIELASAGSKVIVTDINREGGQATVADIHNNGGEASFYALDVSDKKAIEECFMSVNKSEGPIQLAVNNAGISGVTSPIHDIEYQDWCKVMDVNLSGVFLCMQQEIRSMLAMGGGRIVNVSSLAGFNGLPMGSHYSSSKHAVLGLTKTAAIEYGSFNIRINAVCPGFIETDILKSVPQEILDYSTNTRVPMKRIGRPGEVAKAIVWLLSDESSYVTGHALNLDGGFMAF